MLTTARIAISLLTVLLVWEGLVLVFQPAHYILPGPSRISVALVENYAMLLEHGLTTLTEIILGILFGTLVGLTTALAMNLMPISRQFILPVLTVTQALPVFAIGPLLVVWFGYGMASKVVMATLIIYFPFASSLNDGLSRTDPGLLDLATLWRASPTQRLVFVRLPAAIPSLISGLRLAVTVAPIGAVVGEWVGSASGLGFLMLRANSRLQTDLMFAALLVLIVIVVLLRTLLDALVARAAPWVEETA